MSSELYDALRALCLMWTQYCGGPTGHMFMTAGEDTEEVLEQYGLLTHTGNEMEQIVNWGRLEELYRQIQFSDATPHIDPPTDRYEF